MESERVEEEKDRPERRTLTGEINKWLGNKSRGFYFVYGFSLAIVVLWTVYIALIYPTVNRTYDRIYLNQDQTIRELQDRLQDKIAENTALQDTVSQLKSFGQYLGLYPIKNYTNYVPLDGRKLGVVDMYKEEEGYIYLSLDIDTCQIYNRYDSTTCQPLRYDLPVLIGGYATLVVCSERYTLFCENYADSIAYLELWRMEDSSR